MSYSKDRLRKIFDSTSGKCHLCHGKLTFDSYGVKWEVDHSRARSEGGTDHLNNLYPACTSCNRSKQAQAAAAARQTNGVRRRPLSKSQRKTAKTQNSVMWATAGGLVGAAINPGAAILLGLIGAAAGYDQDPDT